MSCERATRSESLLAALAFVVLAVTACHAGRPGEGPAGGRPPVAQPSPIEPGASRTVGTRDTPPPVSPAPAYPSTWVPTPARAVIPARQPPIAAIASASLANIAAGKPVRASGERDSHASDAFDGDVETIWNSGGIPPQWLELRLGGPHAILSVELVVHPSSEGKRAVHEVWFWDDRGHYRRACLFDAPVEDRQTLRCDVDARDVHKVQIITTTPVDEPKESMTWVAWREIRIWGYPQ